MNGHKFVFTPPDRSDEHYCDPGWTWSAATGSYHYEWPAAHWKVGSVVQCGHCGQYWEVAVKRGYANARVWVADRNVWLEISERKVKRRLRRQQKLKGIV